MTRRRRMVLGAAVGAAFFMGGMTLAWSQVGEPTVATETFTNVVTYTIPTETVVSTETGPTTTVVETVTTTVTETVTAPTTTEPPPTTTEPDPPGDPDVDSVGQWYCNGPIDYDYVRVTVTAPDVDAVRWDNCSGRIGRLEVTQQGHGDGVKGRNGSAGQPHDLVVESGWVNCTGSHGDHQDAVSIMGGRDVTFRNWVSNCGVMSDPFGAGVVSEWSPSQGGALVTFPTRVVCVHCVLMAGASNTVVADRSFESGLRDSVICPDRTGGSRWLTQGWAVIDEGNEEPSILDARCTDFAQARLWAEG